jgi:hypothetical protein
MIRTNPVFEMWFLNVRHHTNPDTLSTQVYSNPLENNSNTLLFVSDESFNSVKVFGEPTSWFER